MDWKEFFKPTKWKIIIAVIVLIIIYFIPTIPCYTGLTTGAPGVPREMGTWKICAFGLVRMGNYYDYFGLRNSVQLGFIYMLFLSYLISSIISYFYSTRQKT